MFVDIPVDVCALAFYPKMLFEQLYDLDNCNCLRQHGGELHEKGRGSMIEENIFAR